MRKILFALTLLMASCTIQYKTTVSIGVPIHDTVYLSKPCSTYPNQIDAIEWGQHYGDTSKLIIWDCPLGLSGGSGGSKGHLVADRNGNVYTIIDTL